MNFADPLVWGPLLLAAVVYHATSSVVRAIEAAADRDGRRQQEQLEELQNIAASLEGIALSLDMIESNTHPTMDDHIDE